MVVIHESAAHVPWISRFDSAALDLPHAPDLVSCGLQSGAARGTMEAVLAHPSMTSRGKRIASVIALIVLFFLPKHVECGYPDAECGHDAILRQWCKEYEVEPLGFWVIEKVAHRDVGFAYSHGETCQ
jgi:hypothetical protein